MERGLGESSRITVKIPRSGSVGLSLKDKRDGFCQRVSCNGARRDFEKKRSRVVVSDSESSDDDDVEFMKPPRGGKFVRRTKMDVFEFDEYDGFDSANLMRKRFVNGNVVGVSGRNSFAMGGSGSGREGVFVRRKRPFVKRARRMSSQEESSSESDSDEPIRLQGRNGVLKLKVHNEVPSNHQEVEMYGRPASSSLKAHKRESVVVK